MTMDGTVGSLWIFTLIAVFIVGLVVLLRFLRKPGNRHPMDGVRERNIDEIQQGKPPRREH